MTLPDALLVAGLAATGIFALYGVVFGRLLRNVRGATGFVLARCPAARRNTLGEVDCLIRLTAGAVVLLGVCGAILLLTSMGLDDLHRGPLRPELLVAGVVLGVGELALCTFAGYVGVKVGLALRRGKGPVDVDDWLSLSRGGWMRSFFQAAEVAPAIALVISLLFVTAEEALFRGILIGSLADAGAIWALSVALVLFAAAQAFQMPSWQSALFPVLAALVLGLVHGLLFLAVPTIVPLIVAHWVFFAVSII